MASNPIDYRPRAHLRVPVMLVAEMTGRNERCWARVRDLSDGGLRIATRTRLLVGQIVEIRLASQRWMSARVIWTKDQVAGLRFCRPIDAAEHIGRAVQCNRSSPGSSNTADNDEGRLS